MQALSYQIRSAVLTLFFGMCAEAVRHDIVKLSQREVETLRNRIFLVDSHYIPDDLDVHHDDEQAFHGLMDYCLSCDCISRGHVMQNAGDLYLVRFFCLIAIPQIMPAAIFVSISTVD